MGEFFEHFDLMLTPTVGVQPGPADQPSSPHENAFGGLANTAGVPAIALPAGFSPEGLPIGFQLVGRFGADWHLVNMGREYQQHHSWLEQWPSPR
jgi:aspartyl-tRNA(Asn)/glutamyl-tRNA(Gln) amidotransferase subunit A